MGDPHRRNLFDTYIFFQILKTQPDKMSIILEIWFTVTLSSLSMMDFTAAIDFLLITDLGLPDIDIFN